MWDQNRTVCPKQSVSDKTGKDWKSRIEVMPQNHEAWRVWVSGMGHRTSQLDIITKRNSWKG